MTLALLQEAEKCLLEGLQIESLTLKNSGLTITVPPPFKLLYCRKSNTQGI